jgi:hypothetical protein
LKKQLFPLAICAGGCSNHAKNIKVGMHSPIHVCVMKMKDNPECVQFMCNPCFIKACMALAKEAKGEVKGNKNNNVMQG